MNIFFYLCSKYLSNVLKPDYGRGEQHFHHNCCVVAQVLNIH